MIDAVSLYQLRVFIAAAEEGSFSAAGRKLQRAQSLVSQAVANLEAQLNVKLFDRTNKYPRLTLAGQALFLEAKQSSAGWKGSRLARGRYRRAWSPNFRSSST